MFQIILQLCTVLIPLFRLLLCTFGKNHLKSEQFIAEFSRCLLQKRFPALCDRQKMKRRFRRIPSGDQMMQRCSQTVNVALRTGFSLVILTSILFRCRITGRSETCGIFYIFYFKFSCRTKIDQCDLTVRPQHNVRWFQVTVHNRLFPRMQVIQHITQLNAPGEHIFNPDRQSGLFHAFFQDFIQGFSLDIVHNNQESILIINNIDDTWQIFVIQFL